MWKKRDEVLDALHGMDAAVQAAVVQASAVFFRTDSVGEEVAIVTAEYDGTPAGFGAAVKTLERDPTLLALGTHLHVNDVLRNMNSGSMFLDLALDSVDGIVLQRIGRHIVRINRRGGTAASVGRTLFIELNDWRQRAADVVRSLKGTAADHTIAFLTAIGAVTFATVGAVVLAYFAGRRRP
jgi:hypothetical protein